MTFADKLKNLMKDLDLTQSKLSDLTGIGKSSISQYLSGKNEPSKDRNETDIVYLAEEGVISEAIKEGFTEKAFSELKSNLESSLSKKKAKEFMQAFFEELEAAKIDWVETIDEAVTTALQNAIDEGTEEAAEIIEPEEFCCKYFM